MLAVHRADDGRWVLLTIRLDMIMQGRRPKQFGAFDSFTHVQQVIDGLFQRGYFWVTERVFWGAIDIIEAEERGYGKYE